MLTLLQLFRQYRKAQQEQQPPIEPILPPVQPDIISPPSNPLVPVPLEPGLGRLSPSHRVRSRNAMHTTISKFWQELEEVRSMRTLYRGVFLSLFLNAVLLVALIIWLVSLVAQNIVPPAELPANGVTFLPTLTGVPPTAKAETDFPLSIAVQNSGSNTWSVQHYQMECIPDPSPGQKTDQDCPETKMLSAVTVPVAPKQDYIFTFLFSSSDSQGTHHIRAQMFQDRIPFGQPQDLSFTITG